MEQELEFAKGLAQQAGEIMLEHFQVGMQRQFKPEEGNSELTEADLAINALVIKTIRERYSEHSIIGEEDSHLVEGSKFSWVCDPIDGTASFVFGMPTNVFALALVDHSGQPVVAVVLDPHTQRTYHAIKGGGAFLNGQPIHVNQTDKLSKAAVSSSGRRCKVIDFASFRGEYFGSAFRIISATSTIYEAMLIASGQIAATVLPGSHPWDAAATKLIVEEAGGRVTNLLGEDQRYDSDIQGLIASNGAVHDEIVALAKRYRLES
jgi:myo-inositol-1(or 4)-monophosphatase